VQVYQLYTYQKIQMKVCVLCLLFDMNHEEGGSFFLGGGRMMQDDFVQVSMLSFVTTP
jgi:hypothetical protein